MLRIKLCMWGKRLLYFSLLEQCLHWKNIVCYSYYCYFFIYAFISTATLGQNCSRVNDCQGKYYCNGEGYDNYGVCVEYETQVFINHSSNKIPTFIPGTKLYLFRVWCWIDLQLWYIFPWYLKEWYLFRFFLDTCIPIYSVAVGGACNPYRHGLAVESISCEVGLYVWYVY